MGYSEHSKAPKSIIDAFNEKKYTASSNYMQVVPNSHFWTDLNQLVAAFDVNSPDKEYLLIGLNNTIKRRYKLKSMKEIDTKALDSLVFTSIEKIVEYVKSEIYNEKNFYIMLNATITLGYNLTNELKMLRPEIYKRIDGERDYQDIRWHGCVPDEEKAIAEWLNYIEYHLEKAKERIYHLKPEEALAELRKIAALAVRAMEIHGCPERIMVENSTHLINRTDTPLSIKTTTDGIKPNPDGCCGIYDENDNK